MNQVIVKSVKVQDRKIIVNYFAEGEICDYLNFPMIQNFEIEYSEDISNVPYGIAVIPFVANIIPICWLTNAKLVLDELDEEFYESIPEIKHGFMMMYQKTEFLGEIICSRIVRYKPEKALTKSACLFSGGVDAFATLFAHIEEKPLLVTLLGADVKLTDLKGCEILKGQVKEAALNLNLPEPIFVSTNFRTFLREGYLSTLVKKSGDLYWHGFQHGIGISSHVAPLCYKLGLKVAYMASSFTCGYRGPCASDPIIENNLRFFGSRIFHDRYSYDRQDKLRLIVRKCTEMHKTVNMHVCWESQGGENCCQCEKCLRTIMGLVSIGADPCNYGFKVLHYAELPEVRLTIEKEFSLSKTKNSAWRLIRSSLEKNSEAVQNPDFNWILDLKVKKKYKIKKSIDKILIPLYNKTMRLIKH